MIEIGSLQAAGFQIPDGPIRGIRPQPKLLKHGSRQRLAVLGALGGQPVERREPDLPIGLTEHEALVRGDFEAMASLLRLQLAPGRYEVRSYVRPCEAACPAMDAPTDACTISVAVEPAKTVAVMIERRVGAPCVASTVAP